jgi:hypothetical protein
MKHRKGRAARGSSCICHQRFDDATGDGLSTASLCRVVGETSPLRSKPLNESYPGGYNGDAHSPLRPNGSRTVPKIVPSVRLDAFVPVVPESGDA